MDEELKIIWLLAVGLGLSCLFGYIAQTAKQSPIIGYLLAGYLIGPNSPGFIADPEIAKQLASIGVTLLMFAVGLNFSWKDLIAVKKIALPGALTLATLSILAGTFYSLYLGELLLASFVIGLAICVSSTVVIVRVLSDGDLLHTQKGHIVLGWTIVEDLISVLGLFLLPAFAVTSSVIDSSLYPIFWAVFKVCILGLFVYFLGEKLIEKLLKCIARTRSHELFTLAILACAFLIATGSAYIFGVSLALGAFIAGTIVGKTDLSHQAAANALPMRDAFAVIFFLSVGMLFNPLSIPDNLPLFFGILIILLLLRPLLAFCIVKIAKYPASTAFAVALAIAQIGEYSFILAEEGSQLGVLPMNAYDVLVACAFITIGLNPILFQFFESFYKQNTDFSPLKSISKHDLSIERLSDHSPLFPKVVIIGFGPVGQAVSEYLLKENYNVLIIDQNIDTIASLKGNGVETLFGDATQLHILEKAQIESARLLIITAPDFLTAKAIIQTAKNISPLTPVIARSRFKRDASCNVLGDIPTVYDEEAASEKLISLIKYQLEKYT